MIRFRKSWHYLVFAAAAWGIPVAALHLFSQKTPMDVLFILRHFFVGICGGFVFALLTYPLYIMKLETKRGFPFKMNSARLLSVRFLTLVFCLIAAASLIIQAVEHEPVTFFDIGLSFLGAVALGCSFGRLLAAAKKTWDNARKRALDELYVSKCAWILRWVYFAGFIGCVILGLGFGTFGFIFTGFICRVPLDRAYLAVEIYKRCLIMGFCAGNMQFILLLRSYIQRAIKATLIKADETADYTDKKDGTDE
jgi:hypothetical protein